MVGWSEVALFLGVALFVLSCDGAMRLLIAPILNGCEKKALLCSFMMAAVSVHAASELERAWAAVASTLSLF